MAAVLTEDSVKTSSVSADKSRSKDAPVIEMSDVLVDLGIWLSGVESFLEAGHISFGDVAEDKAPNVAKEFRVVHSTLQRCAMLNALLLGDSRGENADITNEISFKDLRDLSSVLRDACLLSEGMIHSDNLGPSEWKAWSSMLSHRFSTQPGFTKLIRHAEAEGERHLPDCLLRLTESKDAMSAEHAELALILPRFAKVLKWLSVVGKMLETDEPLKPSLLIFSRVNDQIYEMTTYINNRLERFPDAEAELFSSLDAASYTASIELKKVYSQELAGVARLRPSPSVFARIETAHSLLNDGFQQILAGFAKLLDPTTNVIDIFPSFRAKAERSMVLRDELAKLVKVVQGAETTPEKKPIDAMRKALKEFMKGSVRYLFFKDSETVERFVEEILITKSNDDLVPLLHRFGAYLETLYGQVSMRAVLAQEKIDAQ
ncbi:MAG: hypothetical protein ACKVQW_08995 [Pyrinomonadaceae bacterium]